MTASAASPGDLRVLTGQRRLRGMLIGLISFPAFSAGWILSANPVERNLVVLVDRSKSVESRNRESAFRLIGDLVSGRMSQESKEAWKATFPQAGEGEGERPELTNLRNVFEGREAGSLVPDEGYCLVAGLGNYQRTRDLRASIAKGLPGASREEMGRTLAEAASLHGSDDNSTHIKLAESILAQHLIQQSKNPSGYYLIVITDGQEDCFNLPVSVYDKPEELVVPASKPKWTRREGNERVAKGELAYNDGQAGSGKYDAADLEAIGFRDKVDQLLLAEFEYRQQVEAGKRAVKVQVYAQAVKRSLAFSQPRYEWIYPGTMPEIRWTAVGVSPDATLVLRTRTGEEEKIDDPKVSFAPSAGKEFDPQLEDSLVELFPAGVSPGEHTLDLSVMDSTDPRPLKTNATLVFTMPEIAFDDEGYRKSTKEAPAELEDQTELSAARFRGRLSPTPGECVLNARLECDGEQTDAGAGVKIPVDADGRFILTLANFPEEARKAVGNSEIIRLVVSLPKNDEILGDAPAPKAGCYLRVPRVQIWADKFEADERNILLDKGLGVTFKASLAGLPGYSWARPSVLFEGLPNPPGVRASENVVSFDREAEPGIYAVTVGLFRGGSPVGEDVVFQIEVPERRNWTLIVLAAMALVSCGLFGWHFLSRR